MHAPAKSPAAPAGRTAKRWLAAGVIGVAGLLIAGLNAAHNSTILRRAIAGGGFFGQPAFAYDFHFYSLLLVGTAQMLPGLFLVWAAAGLARGRRRGWRLAFWSSVVLAAVTAPLVPLGGFAPLMAGLAAACLAVLVGFRGAFGEG